jgi:transposase
MPVAYEMLIQRRQSVQAGYPGSVDGPAFLQWVMDTCYWLLQVVLRPKEKKRFVLLPKRWVVEHTNGGLLHCRRLVRDDERLPESSETFIYLAMIRSMVRRLA